MKAFYLGLSMAGTVSAGTYTGGTLAELNNWLAAWQEARKNGVTLKAIKSVGTIKQGDPVTIESTEIPDHYVKIKSLSGASGGGVSAGLLLTGLTTGNAEQILKNTWTSFDVRDMLNNDDISKNRSIYSILNVKPIETLKNDLLNQQWTDDFAKDLEYLDDNIEVFLTLASYEGIPFKASPFGGNGVSYGVHKTHLDYIKFNFSKNGTPAPQKPKLPFAYNLVFRQGHQLKDDNSWLQLINSCPATAAFPIGFSPRSLKRFRNEYVGKLFYLNYSYANPALNFDYADLVPDWPDLGGNNEPFDMEYIDGGTFNREPHDLARASLIESLGFPQNSIPHDGIKTNACVILIDPFPTNFDDQAAPGSVVNGIPTLLKQPQYIIGALMDQGRFQPDWIEKALDSNYYSRFLISPIRRDSNHIPQEPALAGGLLGAFSGFIDVSYREHDYKLGHYNTYQFLSNYFSVPVENETVTYCQNITSELKEKYEALGWFIPSPDINKQGYCQIIPRMIEPNLINSFQQPVWPTISQNKWEEVYDLAIERARNLCDAFTNFNWLEEHTIDPAIWKFLLKGKVESAVTGVADKLKKSGLLR